MHRLSKEFRSSAPARFGLDVGAASARRRPWAAIAALVITAQAIGLAYLFADRFWLSKPSAAVHTMDPAKPLPIQDASVAVLPFRTLGESEPQSYLSDGFSEALIDSLGRVAQLRVTANSSGSLFRDQTVPVTEIGKALGVATLLRGTLRTTGARVRISAELVHAQDASVIWSETYERDIGDILNVEAEIVSATTQALGFAAETHAPRPAKPVNAKAYAVYLEGLAFGERYTLAENAKAMEYMRLAARLDPDFAPVWVELADLRLRSVGLFGAPENYADYRNEVASYIDRALKLDSNLSGAHMLKANFLWLFDRDIPGAQAEYARALELDPSNSEALKNDSLFELSLGHIDQAQKLGRAAVARDPLIVEPYRAFGTALYFGGQFADAETAFRKAIAIKPNAESTHFRLALVLLAAGRHKDALAELQNEPSPQRKQIGFALVYQSLGRTVEADAALAAIIKLGTDGWDYQLAEIYAQRQDLARAFDWLGRSYNTHDSGMFSYVKSDPLLEPLRADPRYKALLTKLSLPL